ncbi:MAG: hypothetical protein WC901_00910 [Candidatus Margulisiibacteriota bacterium]
MKQESKHGDIQKPLPSLDISIPMYISTYHEKRHKEFNKQLPVMSGELPLLFYQFLLEQPAGNEGRRFVGDRIVWPYVDRLVNCALIFSKMGKDDQEYIVKARKQETPIWWRGDEMENFKIIARESYRFNQMSEEDKQKYKKSAMIQVARMTSALRRA